MNHHRLTRGDEQNTILCDWCSRGVSVHDITETLDGSQLCPTCVLHYDPGLDEPDYTIGFISNIDRE